METGRSATPRSEVTSDMAIAKVIDLETRRNLNTQPFEVAVDGTAQHAGNLGDADEGLASKITRIECLTRCKPTSAWQDGDERLPQNQFKREVRIRFVAQEGNVDPALFQVLGERHRKPARHLDLDIGQFVAKDPGRGREPSCFLFGEKPDGENRLSRPGGAAGRLHSGFGLRQRQTSVIKKGPAGRRQFDAAHAASEQRNADLVLEVADLAAEGWLRHMQAALRRKLHASRFCDRDEIAKMPQLHSLVDISHRHIKSTYKVFFSTARGRYLSPEWRSHARRLGALSGK
jgi:hypothetical protein